jgi:hypothetical protein
MSKIGYKSHIGYAEEATFGTAVQPTGFVEYNSEGFKKEREEKLVDAINGTQHYKKRVTLNESITGNVSFPLMPGSILRFLKNGIGDAITVTSLAAGVFQYKFIAGINSLTSFTIRATRDTSDTTTSFNYTGSCINSIKFGCGVNDILKCDVDFICQNEVAANTISTAAYRVTNPYTFVQGSVKIGNASASATSPVVDSWGCTVSNNLVETRAIGSALVARLTPGMQDVTYDVSAIFDNNTLYNRFLNGTQSYVYAKFDSGVTIASTFTESITFESFNCYFNGSTANVGGPSELLKGSYPIRSIFADGSTTTLLITVVTGVATITTS